MKDIKDYGEKIRSFDGICDTCDGDGDCIIVDDAWMCPNCVQDKLNTARKDTARIDWIDRNMDCTLAGPGLHVSLVEQGDDQTLREAIDEAMKENEQ